MKATNAPAGIIDALDDALHTYHDDLNGNQESGCDVQQADKNKHVLLEFDDNITLSSKLIYAHDEQEDETKLPAITFDEDYRCANDPGKVNSQSHVIFYVAIDGKPMKKGKIEATRVGSLQMQMGNCTVSSPPAATGRPNQVHPAANINPTYNVPMSVGGSVSRPPAKRYRHPAAGGAGPFPSAYQQPAAGTYGLNNPTAAAPVGVGGGAPVGAGAAAPTGGGGACAGAPTGGAGAGAPTGGGAVPTGGGGAVPTGGGGWNWWPYGTSTNQGTQVLPLNQQAQQVQQ